MKKILFLLLGLFTLTTLRAQVKQEYPQSYIKDGKTYVVFTLEQAQKIDNDYDLLVLLKQSKAQYEKLDTANIIVINNLGAQVAELKLKINTLDGLLKDRDMQINNLKDQINKYEKDQLLANEQSMKKDSIISNNTKQIRKLKRQKFLGFTVGGGGLVSVIVLLLLKK